MVASIVFRVSTGAGLIQLYISQTCRPYAQVFSRLRSHIDQEYSLLSPQSDPQDAHIHWTPSGLPPLIWPPLGPVNLCRGGLISGVGDCCIHHPEPPSSHCTLAVQWNLFIVDSQYSGRNTKDLSIKYAFQGTKYTLCHTANTF